MLVCEGYAEVELVRVVRDCYLPRDCGTSLKWENSRGAGGSGALEVALRLQREGAFAEFETIYGAPAHRQHVIERHFDSARFDDARPQVAAIDLLLRFLGR
jgi:hypothetical protein